MKNTGIISARTFIHRYSSAVGNHVLRVPIRVRNSGLAWIATVVIRLLGFVALGLAASMLASCSRPENSESVQYVESAEAERVEAYDGYWFGMSYEQARAVRDVVPLQSLRDDYPGWLEVLEKNGIRKGLMYSKTEFGQPAAVFVAFRGDLPVLESVEVKIQSKEKDFGACLAQVRVIREFYSKRYGQPEHTNVIDLQSAGLSRYVVRGRDGNDIGLLPFAWRMENGRRIYFSDMAATTCGMRSDYASVLVLYK